VLKWPHNYRLALQPSRSCPVVQETASFYGVRNVPRYSEPDESSPHFYTCLFKIHVHFLSLIPPSFISSVSLFAFPLIYFVVFNYLSLPFFPPVLAVVCIACNSRNSTSCLTSPAYVTILYTLRTRQNAHGPLLA